MSTPWPADQPINVGITYPKEWYRDDAGFENQMKQLEALDSRVRVLLVPLEEPHELRSARRHLSRDEIIERSAPLSDEQRRAFAQLDVALGLDLPTPVSTHAPKLTWFQNLGAGTDHVESTGLYDIGARVTNSAGSNATGIAEFAFGRLVAEWKRFREIDAAQTRHEWANLFGRELSGMTLGLIGLGAIAKAVARRAKAFDMTVVAVRRSGPGGEPVDVADEILGPDGLHAMLGRADSVIAAVPDSPETRGIMDRAAFAAMRPGSFFCNVGRGTLVDEAALIDALNSGHLRGAALDVAHAEPLPADDPLWTVPNLALSAHCSSSPDAMFVNVHRMFNDNLRRFLAGQPLENQVAPPTKG
jgi:phosphoglycerate dehydrogenase-like enzyme